MIYRITLVLSVSCTGIAAWIYATTGSPAALAGLVICIICNIINIVTLKKVL